MSTNAYDSVLAPQTGGELAPPEDRTLLGRTKEIAITIDDIQEFPLNPRQSDNPALMKSWHRLRPSVCNNRSP